ncbi:exopolysaccharide biosynthesis protein [Allopontixanthobacter sp.]|uniref:exopolysaccharide biosynthesis protein n=1 Tax=Allopontixanthobacter sp. TaxID=2906452 RepID=UPI002ABAAC55|nr:exopolysaccharide biosynthesis protein [Allopontixanthobacter sp.]MDZ4306571.1 exopolysaccharide biosynthesis protein [Allopontixanthobacter sp.]
MANGAPAAQIKSVCDILDELRHLAADQDRVAIGDVLDAIGDRSYGPALILPALVEISPIGGIPGVPTFLALMIALTAAQLLLAKEHLWLPQFIQRRSVGSGKLRRAADKLDGLAVRLDKWFHRRFHRFVGNRWQRIAAGAVILLCLLVPPLELVPFASTVPMLVIMAVGLAILVRDGLLMMIAIGLAAATIVGGIGLAASSDLLGGSGTGG